MDKQEKQKTEKQESKVQGTKVMMDAGKAPKKNKGSEAKSTKETTGNEPQIPGVPGNEKAGGKRYESDLTRKERRELEKEKLKSMGWKGRLQYIWMYYKPAMAAILAVILVGAGIHQWVENLKNKDIFYLAVINSSMMYGDDLETDFKAYLGDEDPYDIVNIDTSMAMYEESGSAYGTQMKIVTLVAAGSIDVMVSPEDVYEQYSGQDMFLDLKDVLDADLYEKLKDDIDGDRLDLSNSTKWKETGMTGYEPAYLTIVSSGKHLENTVKFIEYLYE